MRRAAQVYARDDEAPSTEATLGVEEEPGAAPDGHEPAATQPRVRRKKCKIAKDFIGRRFVEASSISMLACPN